MKHVYTGRDEMDAHFVRGLLEQQGIQAVVQGEALGTAMSGLPLSNESTPSVWVEEVDAQRAAAIVEEYTSRDKANANPESGDERRSLWICPNCGEKVEDQFTQCWKCSHKRPSGPATTNA